MILAEPFWFGVLRKFPRTLRMALVCAIVLVRPHPATGQVIQLTGGSSSLLEAEGGSVEVRGANYTGRIDLGYLGRPSLGFSYSRPFQSSLLDAGDQQIPFLLPTDLFDRSYYFLARGLSLAGNADGGRFLVFGGATSNGYFAPFLSVARGDTPSGAVFYEKKLSPTLHFFSRNIFSSRQTSIQAIEWAARKDIKMALSAGMGNNQPYGASSFSMDKHWLLLDASYTRAGDQFRRVLVATPQLSENDRENIRLELHPINNFRLVINRNNYFSSVVPVGIVRAMVQGIGVGAAFAGFQTYGSLFESSTELGNSSALALGVRRRLMRHFEAGVDLLHSAYSKGAPSRSVIGNLREVVNSRLSVTQTITHNNGQTTIDFGGTFLSNFLSLSVDYQTVFLPFVQNGPGQFKQVMVLGLHFQLPHGVQFNMDTNVTPLGQVRYTAYGSTYAYHGIAQASPGTSFSGAFLRNVVRGEVLDPQGEPIAGAALRIGTELTVTDSYGDFMVRLKKADNLELKVAFDEFTAPGNYVIVEAPATVKPAREESAEKYRIVLRRLPNAISSTDPSPQPRESPAPSHALASNEREGE